MSKADALSRKLKEVERSEANNEAMRSAHDALLNERANEPTNVPASIKVERRRFSFDIRPELHRQLKMQCLIDDTNMYEVVENLIENYLIDRKK